MVGPKRVVNKQLGELLLEQGIINQKQLDEALQINREKGGLIGQVLVELGYAKEEDIAQALTVQFGFPYLPLKNYDIDPNAVRLIPEAVAKQYCLIPIDKLENTLIITVSNPLNKQALEDVEDLTNCDVQMFISTMTDINGAIDKYYEKKGKGDGSNYS